MSELNTARDIIEIQYNGHMGFARLSPSFRATIGSDILPVSFYLLINIKTNSFQVRLERPYCTIHCPSNFVVSSTFDLPFVRLPLQIFSENVHFLLSHHNGGMPLGRLISFLLYISNYSNIF
jgi:hypothetical protein